MAPLHRTGDEKAMTDAIDLLLERGVDVYRPSPIQLKCGPISYYPSTGTVVRDGSGKEPEKGLKALARVLDEVTPKRDDEPGVIRLPT
jgi:hypothetical protein